MDLGSSMMISTSGMKAQGARMRIIAENMANSSSIAPSEGEDPYRRKVISFTNQLDRELGVRTVQVDKIAKDRSDFGRRYDPGHPAADADGYVRTTNVEALVESNDMREAQRTYQANLSAVDAAKTMMMRTLDLLR
ncbi:MAG: flagellar basal body rod protein FlgC [Sphingomonadales bacterium]